jgi:hypothetical protein
MRVKTMRIWHLLVTAAFITAFVYGGNPRSRVLAAPAHQPASAGCNQYLLELYGVCSLDELEEASTSSTSEQNSSPQQAEQQVFTPLPTLGMLPEGFELPRSADKHIYTMGREYWPETGGMPDPLTSRLQRELNAWFNQNDSAHPDYWIATQDRESIQWHRNYLDQIEAQRQASAAAAQAATAQAQVTPEPTAQPTAQPTQAPGKWWRGQYVTIKPGNKVNTTRWFQTYGSGCSTPIYAPDNERRHDRRTFRWDLIAGTCGPVD